MKKISPKTKLKDIITMDTFSWYELLPDELCYEASLEHISSSNREYPLNLKDKQSHDCLSNAILFGFQWSNTMGWNTIHDAIWSLERTKYSNLTIQQFKDRVATALRKAKVW